MDSECIRVQLLGSLEVQRRGQDGTWSIIEREAFGKPKHARSVLKRLLTAPGRRLSRSMIQDDLWPEIEMGLADSYLYNAVAKIRSAIGRDLLSLSDSIYEIAGQATIWVDLDHVAALMASIENQDRRSIGAIVLLKEALGYLTRGSALEGEDGTWCYSTRRRAEDMARQCRLWLADAYAAQGKIWQACEQYRTLCQALPPDEEALQSWMRLLLLHGKQPDAFRCYQDTKALWEAQGFSLPPIQSFQDIMGSEHRGGELSVYQSRRNLLQGLLGATSAAILYPDTEILERLSGALRAPSDLNEATLMHLEHITREHRYAFVRSDGKTWQELFQDMSGHLRVVTQQLERHQQHAQLRTIASETALLLGDILFNAGENEAADTYYQAAFEASQGNGVLSAVILSRKALPFIYSANPQVAVSLIEDAQQIAPVTAADLVLAWLWVVKAEAYAALGASTECFQALQSSEQLLERGRSGDITLHFQPDITYATFDQTKLSGYKGACLLRLNRSEAAQPILHDQLLQVQERALLHQQSIAQADLAQSFGQQAALRQAYEHASLALDVIEQTRSVRVFQRILKLRRSLSPWEQTPYVKNLDEHIHLLAPGFMKGTQ